MLLYAVRYPQRLRTFTLVAPSMKAAGVRVPDLSAALTLRSAEPWYPAAREAIDKWSRSASVTESLPYR